MAWQFFLHHEHIIQSLAWPMLSLIFLRKTWNASLPFDPEEKNSDNILTVSTKEEQNSKEVQRYKNAY